MVIEQFYKRKTFSCPEQMPSIGEIVTGHLLRAERQVLDNIFEQAYSRPFDKAIDKDKIKGKSLEWDSSKYMLFFENIFIGVIKYHISESFAVGVSFEPRIETISMLH